MLMRYAATHPHPSAMLICYATLWGLGRGRARTKGTELKFVTYDTLKRAGIYAFINKVNG